MGVGCEVDRGRIISFDSPTGMKPPYFTGKVLPCCIIDGTKCHCTGGMEPCVQWHFLNKHYLLNLCFMYSLAFNSRVSSSGASGSI